MINQGKMWATISYYDMLKFERSVNFINHLPHFCEIFGFFKRLNGF